MRLLPALAAFAFTSATAVACANRPSVRPAMAAAGAALAIAGTAVALSAQLGEGEDTDGDGIDEFPDHELSCAFFLGTCFLETAVGATLASWGIGMLAVSVTTSEPLPPLTPFGAASPSPMADVTPSSQRPIPLLHADRQTVQLAKQARGHAMGGRCELARMAAMQVKARDPAYFNAMVQSGVVAGC